MRWVALLLLVAAAGLAGCLEGGNIPDCDVPVHQVRLEVEGVDANLTRAGVFDAGDPYGIRACSALPDWFELDVDGPGTVRGDVPVGTDVDQVWLFHEAGLARLGTNVTVDANATVRVEADGPPVRSATLSWAGEAAPVCWTEWYRDPGALDPVEVGVGPRPIGNATGNLTLPVNSTRNEGIDAVFGATLNRSRHANWSAYQGSREGVRVAVALHAPNGTRVAGGNWTPVNGTDLARLDAPGGATGNWTLRWRTRAGEARPGDLRYQVEAGVLYGAPADEDAR